MADFIPGGVGGFSSRPAARKVPNRSYTRSELMPPPRPPRNFVPAQELIDSLVDRALAALLKGIYWDRGSIINLVL